MVAFNTRMPAGIPGAVSRATVSTVEPVMYWPQGTTGAFPAYGLAGIIDATTGQFRVVASADTLVYGIAVRPYPASQSLQATLGLGQGTPLNGIGDALKSGYMTVKLQNTTAATKGGLVYVCTSAPPTGGVIGGFEAASGTGRIALGTSQTNSYFMGPADAQGNVEICFNI